jgi:4-hydroxy-4-methyl-2-oxoglutarate aldolase
MKLKFLASVAVTCAMMLASSASAQVQTTREQVQFFTSKWTGERYPDGRPKVPDDIIKRMQNVSIEQAWALLRQNGFNNQFEGEWLHLDTDDTKPIIGRALTIQFMPLRPDMRDPLAEQGKRDNRLGPHNAWPIDMLQNGDVYVADSYGKIADGTLMGDRLGNGIYSRSKNGIVVYGSVRDEEGLRDIKGFNGVVKGFHPSAIREMQMVQVNPPIRIGEATVLPGDVVLVRRGGAIFIPAYLAEQVVLQSELERTTDGFAHAMVQNGTYTSGQMDQALTPEMKAHFRKWLAEDPKRVYLPRDKLNDMLTKAGY